MSGQLALLCAPNTNAWHVIWPTHCVQYTAWHSASACLLGILGRVERDLVPKQPIRQTLTTKRGGFRDQTIKRMCVTHLGKTTRAKQSQPTAWQTAWSHSSPGSNAQRLGDGQLNGHAQQVHTTGLPESPLRARKYGNGPSTSLPSV